MNNSIFDLITYFIIYSFLGWLVESVYRSFCEKKIINSGFLMGPVCPIYGIGALIMLLCMNNLKKNYILLFIISFIVLTIWEYIVGFLLEKIFKTKYWDYSDKKFNIHGRVCLTNSLYWGILGSLFINFIHPVVNNLVFMIRPDILHYIIYTLLSIMIIDAVVSIVKIANLNTALEKIEKINKEIKEKLSEIKMIGKEADKEKIKENMQLLVESLKDKRNNIFNRIYKNVSRLKKAFPAINTKEITEILNKKVELKKTKKK